LHPAIRIKAAAFIVEANRRGIPLIATSGLRTFDEQQKLYNQGRSEPGAIVTNARPGESFHNYGLAIDVAPVGGWENFSRWREIGEMGKSLGFKWLALVSDGGSSRSLNDKPHFEYTGATIAQLKELWRSGQHDGDYVRLAA